MKKGTPLSTSFETRLRSNNTSGHPGVYWRPKSQNWQVGIRAYGVYLYIGTFTSYRKAVQARREAQREVLEIALENCR